MIIPLITLAKLVALGSIKFIFLLLGIAFFPKFALRIILNGATGMLIPALTWLVENERLALDRHDAIIQDLTELEQIKLTSLESRQLLWKLLKKMLVGLIQSVKNAITWVGVFVKKLSR